MWRRIVVHGVPLVLAVCAALLLLPWIMGASAIRGDSAANGYNVGMIALFVYPASYQILLIGWGVSHWMKWPLKSIFVRLIWLSVLLFAAAMAYSVVQLQAYLQGSTV